MLEGRWCCGEKCLRARVTSIVRREFVRNRPQQAHRHRVPLGLLLLTSHAITEAQLHAAVQRAKTTQRRLSEVLVAEFGLSQQKLAEARARQWGCGSWDVRGTLPDGMAAIAPRAVLEAARMLPLRIFSGGQLAVAFDEGLDAQATLALQRIHHCQVESGIAAPDEFLQAARRLSNQRSVAVEEVVCDSTKDAVRQMVRIFEKQAPVESRWARVHDVFWLRLWLEPAALAGGISQVEDVKDYIFPLHDIPDEQKS